MKTESSYLIPQIKSFWSIKGLWNLDVLLFFWTITRDLLCSFFYVMPQDVPA